MQRVVGIIIIIALQACGSSALSSKSSLPEMPAGDSVSVLVMPLKGKPHEATCGDFNGDGWDDLAIAAKYTGTHVFLNAPGGLFSENRTLTGLPHVISIKNADVNSDGATDLIVLVENLVQIFLGDGKGNFIAANKGYEGPVMSGYLAVANLNNDTLPDFILGGGADPRLFIYLNQGNLEFRLLIINLAEANMLVPPGFSHIAVTDLDGDGKPDVLVSDNVRGTLWVLWNEGNGEFSPTVLFKTTSLISAASYHPKGQALSDVLAIAVSQDGTVFYLKNNGGRSFSVSHKLPVPPMPDHIQVADMNKDGYDDLVLTHITSDTPTKGRVSVLYGPDFTRRQEATLGGVGFNSTVCDWNRDGFPEIISPGASSNTFSVVTFGNR